MVKYLFVHLNGLLVNITGAYDSVVKLQWLALRQSNTKFQLSLDEYVEVEKRVRPLVVGEGRDFWLKFWKHVLVELGVHPVPSVVRDLFEKFRVFFVNSSELYPDALDFLNLAKSRGLKVVLVESGSEELVNRALDKFGLKSSFHRVILVPELTRAAPAFFDFAVEKLGVRDGDVCVLCSRADKDYASAVNLNRVLVLRRFYERVNKDVPDMSARNLLQVFDLLPEDEGKNDFYSSVIDELDA
jgi:FMN phosphatase YigB (HAD superfamily)